MIILRRSGHEWPVLIAANRDEMADRPWRAPGRHWPDRPQIVGGLDQLGGGSWLGINTAGVVAGVLNRLNTLGPAPGRRSRGDLPLNALASPDAESAALAIAAVDAHAYRPFNLLLADAGRAFWVRCPGAEADGGIGRRAGRIEVHALPDGLSMITAYDRNDVASPRIRHYLPRFRSAPAPDPGRGDWRAWVELLGCREMEPSAGPGGAMTVVTDTGFGTVSSSLIALPAADRAGCRPVWLFAAGRPDEAPFMPTLL
jgi:hypothetical protein